MNNLLIGDCRNILPTLEAKSVQCVVTSPPYYKLRDYDVEEQIGQEDTVEEYVKNLVDVFREVKRVLKDDGTLWLNLGDSYAGSGKARTKEGTSANIGKRYKQSTHKGSLQGRVHKTPLSGWLKPKDLIGVPWRVAFALQEDGWYLRQDIIWHKPNVMPESVKDRCTKSHEYIFLLSKHKNYYFDAEAIKEPVVSIKGNNKIFRNGGVYTKGQSYFNSKKIEAETHGNKPNESGKRNKRDVWIIPTHPYKGAHFAAFPLGLVIPCVLAGSREGDVILDPFFGTVAEAAALLNRNWLGIDINPDYEPLYKQRLALFA
ncbi:DNA-methyltransferase [Treponema sp.]|uniref:DNA-methyltransferase n=1 Tax=Treponema sp. TaxID=166 RepID=UPI003FA2DD03